MRLVAYLFLFLKNVLILADLKVSTLVLIYFAGPQHGRKIKTNCKPFQNVDLRICSIFIFYKERLGPAFPPHFVYNISRKMFLLLYSINLPGLIAWLPSLFEILRICI